MYQVIKMYGDWEPWWFLEGWTADITEQRTFESFELAAEYYDEAYQEARERYSCYDSRKNFLAAFWNQGDERWCEECDEALQQYYSLLLLKDGEILPSSYHRETLAQKNCRLPEKTCRLTT